MQSLQRK